MADNLRNIVEVNDWNPPVFADDGKRLVHSAQSQKKQLTAKNSNVLYNWLVKLNGWSIMKRVHPTTMTGDTPVDTRSRVLGAAAEEFAANGLAGARVDRIARLAGVNKAMIYYHFSSKENLYQTIIDQQVELVVKGISDLADAATDLESALMQLSRAYHAAFGGDQRFRAIFLHDLAAGGQRLKKSLTELIWKKGLPARLKQLLDEGIREGRYRHFDSRHALISFAGMNLFYLVLMPIAVSIWEIEDEKEFSQSRPAEIVDIFMRGITKR